LALDFAGPGVNLALLDCEPGPSLVEVESGVEKLGACVISARIDVRDSRGVQKFVDDAARAFGRIDIGIVNAGVAPPPGGELSLSIAREMMEVNYFGALHTIIPLRALMLSQEPAPLRGSIVVVTSIGGLVSTHNSGEYSASKMALHRYVDGLRLQLKWHDIRLTNVVLGFVRTRMIEGRPHAQHTSFSVETASKQIINRIARGRRDVSIPRMFNLPWLLLQTSPSRLRSWLLQRAYGRLKV
jgi:NAD(P)-dependent dehydrogenase (short-subunit alcohol dehydrogenase family)